MSIYVGNLAFAMTEEDLFAIFANYGTVKRVDIPLDRQTSRSRGFAFVEMEAAHEEAAAMAALDGAKVMARNLRVNKARPKVNR